MSLKIRRLVYGSRADACVLIKAKHGVLGLVRSLHYTSWPHNISVCMVAPWFTDTPILPLPTKLILAGLPKNEMSDVVRAIIYVRVFLADCASAVQLKDITHN